MTVEFLDDTSVPAPAPALAATEGEKGVETGVPSPQSERKSDFAESHHAHSKLTTSLSSNLISKPRQRQKWGDTQMLPHVNWGDLFFDLFYVGAAYNLSTILIDQPTGRGLLYFFGCFFPIMMIWMDKLQYDSRFAANDDAIHRIQEVAIIIALATAVLHIRPVGTLGNPEEYVDMLAFSTALCIASILHLARFVEILIWVDGQPAAKRVARAELMYRGIPSLFFLAAAIFSGIQFYTNQQDDYHRFLAGDETTYPYADADTGTGTTTSTYKEETNKADDELSINDLPIFLCFAVPLSYFSMLWIRIIYCMPGGGRHKQFSVPMHIDFVIHRYGEWTMLMLGEAILSLLIVDLALSPEYYLTFYAGIGSVVLLQYMHFRSQPSHADGHAMRRSKDAGVVFNSLYQIYSAALVILGSSYKMLLLEYTYDDGYRRQLAGGGDGGLASFSTEDRRQRVANLFGGSLAVVWFTSDMMILTHKGIEKNINRCYQTGARKHYSKGSILVILRGALIVFAATLSLYVTDPEEIALLGLAGIVVQVILRAMGASLSSHTGSSHHLQNTTDDKKWPNVTHGRTKEDDCAIEGDA